jgi:peptidoglycan/LPS O-acetylase OafA/YrhL
VAAEVVVIGHASPHWPALAWTQPPHFAAIQSLAVAVFFVLSGLLITMSVAGRKPSLGEYFIERFSRIYSGLIPALLIIAVVDGAMIALYPQAYHSYPGYSFLDFMGNVLMLQDYPLLLNYTGITNFGTAHVLWTLAIEWWIYLAFGWLVLVRNRGWAFWLGLLIVLPVPLYNLFLGRGDCLTSMWLLGAATYFAVSDDRLTRRIDPRWALLIAALFAIFAFGRVLKFKEPYDLVFALMASISIALAVVGLNASRWTVPPPLARLLRFCADFSFTLYLLHQTVIAAVELVFAGFPGWQIFWISVVGSTVLSALIATQTEMRNPALRHMLKRRFVQSDRTPARASLPAEQA